MNKKTRKNIIQTFIGVLVASFFLYITFSNVEDTDVVFDSIMQTNKPILILSVIFLFTVYALRAYRWKLLIEGAGEEVKFKNVFSSVLIMYMVNSVTTKLGEITRCTVLYKTNNISIAKSGGTVIAERVVDLLVLIMGVTAVFFLELDRLKIILDHVLSMLDISSVGNVLIYLGLLFLASSVVLFLLRKQLFKIGFINKIYDFLLDMLKSGLSIFKLKKYKQFILITVLIWVFLILMNYCFIMSLPATQNLGIYFALILLFMSGIGWAFPSPGGLGTTNIIVLELFVAFNYSEEAGVAIGMISFGTVFIFSIVFGLISLVYNAVRHKVKLS